MTNTKFTLDETVEIDGHKLRRLVALEDFNDVKQGDKGGLIEDEAMLDRTDDSWVYGNSYVAGEGSFITGDSEVYDNAKVTSSQITNSTIRNNSEVHESNVNDSYVHKSSRVFQSTLDDAYLSHNTQARSSNLKATSLEAAYIQDAELTGIEEAHIVQIGDQQTQMDMIDSAELDNYDETNIETYIERHRADLIELSDDDLSDLNEQENTLQQ